MVEKDARFVAMNGEGCKPKRAFNEFMRGLERAEEASLALEAEEAFRKALQGTIQAGALAPDPLYKQVL